MTKLRAALIHLAISACIVGAVLSVIFFIWYPGPTFRMSSAMDLVLVMVGVDLVVGPILTLIVYEVGKKGLKFDLTVIALVQLIALSYGTWTFYQERPYYLVFVVDRFNLVAEKHIDKSLLAYDELLDKPFADVIPVFARLPEDPDEFQIYFQSVLEGEPDLESRPEYWEPYSAGTAFILERARPLSELTRNSEFEDRRVQAAIDRHKALHPNLGILPVGTLKEDIGMIMDMDTAEPLDIVLVDPWPERKVDEDAVEDEPSAIDLPGDIDGESADAAAAGSASEDAAGDGSAKEDSVDSVQPSDDEEGDR